MKFPFVEGTQPTFIKQRVLKHDSCPRSSISVHRITSPRLAVSAQSSESDDVREDDSGVGPSEEDDLTAKFMRFVNETKQQWPLDDRWPTPLLSPAAVVRAQVSSMRRKTDRKQVQLNSHQGSIEGCLVCKLKELTLEAVEVSIAE